MTATMEHAADCLIEGAKAMNASKRWAKLGDTFSFIKPIKKFAYEQALYEVSYAEIQFKMADLFKRVDDLERN